MGGGDKKVVGCGGGILRLLNNIWAYDFPPALPLFKGIPSPCEGMLFLIAHPLPPPEGRGLGCGEG